MQAPTLINESIRRRVFCVLSARSLPYAKQALTSLFANTSQPLSLSLITDSEVDKQELSSAVTSIGESARHEWTVHAQAEADERAQSVFSRHAHLRSFRMGHPCWRKLTDPILFSSPGEEMIILDPDLYFPNYFSFEPTPDKGIMLMWQPPSCLLPHEVVMSAYEASIKLAHHVDIGVAQLRNDLDLDWFDWLIGKLGGKSIPRVMHVEAIVWAALAMRVGGGYFDPDNWYCFRYKQWKRVLLRLGLPGIQLLRWEKLATVKCFHASGVAKWWVDEACQRQVFQAPRSVISPSPIAPFEELTLMKYEADQRLKQFIRKLGYYKIMTARA
jgi:hypothetical protein